MTDMFNGYWVEFVTIAVVHLIAVASPGPDFAIVVKHAVKFGRRAAIMTSIGIAIGILLHVFYSIVGLSLIIKNSPLLYQSLLFLAAGYFCYIGFLSLRSKPEDVQVTSVTGIRDNSKDPMSDVKALRIGFITNGINPKATLFFLSLFSVVIAPTTPLAVKWGYGIYVAIATGCWFIGLSLLLSNSHVDQYLQRYRHLIDRMMGVVLILLAISLIYTSIV